LRKRGIYLFTNRVIAHFGSNFLKITWDFADLRVGRTSKPSSKYTLGIYLDIYLGKYPDKYPGKYPVRYLPGIYIYRVFIFTGYLP